MHSPVSSLSDCLRLACRLFVFIHFIRLLVVVLVVSSRGHYFKQSDLYCHYYYYCIEVYEFEQSVGRKRTTVVLACLLVLGSAHIGCKYRYAPLLLSI